MKSRLKKTAKFKSLSLRLYIAGSAPNSQKAIANINMICASHFDGAKLEIIDLLEDPRRALADGIIVTPTLLKIFPLPLRRVIGNLSDTHQVLLALGGT